MEDIQKLESDWKQEKERSLSRKSHRESRGGGFLNKSLTHKSVTYLKERDNTLNNVNDKSLMFQIGNQQRFQRGSP